MSNLKQLLRRLKKVFSISAILLAIFVLTSSSANAGDKNLVRVFADGSSYNISTDASTVGEILNRLDLQVSGADLVEPELSTVVDEPSFNINVYRSRSIAIYDGDSRTVVQSPYNDGLTIAKNAGLDVYREDIFELSRITNFLDEGIVGMRLDVYRSTPYEVDVFGKVLSLRTQEKTVSKALESNGIDISEAQRISVDVSSELQPNQQITLFATTEETVTEEEEIAFSERVTYDSSIDSGERVVTKPGVNGKRVTVYEVLKENEIELSRIFVSSYIDSQPEEQLVTVGTKTYSVGGTKEEWIKAAGIPESQWSYVDFLVGKESSWNPNAINPSSGACGLGQQLPCGKWDSYGTWNDPVAALRAMNDYVQGYGGWAGAADFWACTGSCYSGRTGGNVYKSTTWY